MALAGIVTSTEKRRLESAAATVVSSVDFFPCFRKILIFFAGIRGWILPPLPPTSSHAVAKYIPVTVSVVPRSPLPMLSEIIGGAQFASKTGMNAKSPMPNANPARRRVLRYWEFTAASYIWSGQGQNNIRTARLVAEFCVRSGASPVTTTTFDLPLRPALGPAFSEVKSFSPWAERFLGQELFASGAELLSILLCGADTVGKGLIGGQFDRVCGHAQHVRNMPQGRPNLHPKFYVAGFLSSSPNGFGRFEDKTNGSAG